MKRFTISTTVLLAFAALSTPPANGQWVPRPDSDPPQFTPDVRVVSEFRDQQLTLRTEAGTNIVTPNSRNFFARFAGQSEVEVEPVENGVDFHITFHNPTATPVRFPMVYVGGIRLGQRLQTVDIRRGTEPRILDHGGQVPHFPPAWIYPDQTYSPVLVLGNDSYWLGASLLYDVLEHDQSVRLGVVAPSGPLRRSGLNWELQVAFYGELEPGGTREYTLALRLTRHDPSEPYPWLRTLVPYRDHFQKTYGSLAYTRDPRPVRGIPIAQKHALSDERPFGYGGNRRPDVHGWKPWADVARRLPDTGWQRAVMWSPSGLYRQNEGLNYPFPFMTPMLSRPAQQRSLHELASISSDQLDFGFYWGRATRIMRGWDNPEHEPLDPHNPEHRRLAFAELDLAVELNAKLIGLDAYDHIRPKHQHEWLKMMMERHPHLKFCTELAASDIIHLLAPTWVTAFELNAPKVMADFLMPGHETWGAIRFDLIEGRLGRRLSDSEVLDEIERVASMGYVPVVFDPTKRIDVARDFSRFLARPTWETTVPADLRQSPRTNAPPDDDEVPRETLVLSEKPQAPGLGPAGTPTNKPTSPTPQAPDTRPNEPYAPASPEAPPAAPTPGLGPTQRETAAFPLAPRMTVVMNTPAPAPAQAAPPNEPERAGVPVPALRVLRPGQPGVATFGPSAQTQATFAAQLNLAKSLGPKPRPNSLPTPVQGFRLNDIQDALRRAQATRQGDN